MKTIPPPCLEPETGPKYWRSLDQLTDNAEFREFLEREFPANASEWTDPVSRRHFVKIMSASLALGGVGLSGCRPPEEHIVPFGKMPEHYIHGIPRYYATAMPTRGSALPLLVRSHDGRPTKVEGNSQHPDSNGSTDAFAQASILGLYDPDRATRFTHNGNTVPRETALDFLGTLARRFLPTGGQGLRFLLERSSSPSRARLLRTMAQQFPQARFHSYEPVDFDLNTETGTGKTVGAYYKLEAAKVIVSLDSDFMGAEQDSYRLIRGFSQNRNPEKSGEGMNRLYVVEALMTLTGMNADHRLRIPASAVTAIAAALAARVAPGDTAVQALSARLPLHPSVTQDWIDACADDLTARRGVGVVMAGYRQPLVVHVLADIINNALGNVGKTVFFQEQEAAPTATITELGQALDQNLVDTLVIVGGNPGYNAPVDLNWAQAQAKAKTVVRWSYYADETAWHEELYAGASQKPEHWDLPATHYLESWGDARTGDGTLVPIQPLIAPLFGGVTELEVLARLGNQPVNSPYDIVRETFRLFGGQDENRWRRFLHDGYLEGSAAPRDRVVLFPTPNVAALLQAATVLPAPSMDQLEVVFARDYTMDDGRYNNNGWLQEMPDPVTKLTWENVILLSPKTAKDLGVYYVDKEMGKLPAPVVKIELNGRSIEGPLWIQPGMADNTIGLALGYGRRRTGRVGSGSGYNAYAVRASAAEHIAAGGKLSRTTRNQLLATTQNHWSMEGRPVVREANLEDYQKHPQFVKGMDLEEPPVVKPLYPNPLDKAAASQVHQWGMAIDLSKCVGCSACMMACQSENNLPIVGKQQVAKSREMHWIRIDRYYAGPVEDPQVVNQPMLCQHCEAAPCESVCPVNATVHDQEGLNLMVYNRCVGTRYCSNNCPYKVRRFNYFDYNRRPLDQLYKSPLTSSTHGRWELARWWDSQDSGSKAEDEWDLLKMVRNPDVTVRMRGVMEKCTFCVQRIEQAKIAQKIQARASGDIEVPDNTIKTACQAACPADAIVFGNIKDPQSQVSKLKEQTRNYSVLEFLLTKPRLTYLARIRNPNTKMPDYQASPQPRSLQEFEKKNHTNPFEPHGGHGGEAVPHAKGEA